MPHRLDPLLRPRSVAVIGASARPDSMGWWALENLARGGYRGTVLPVNPNYRELEGLACAARIADLPETPDLAIFAIGDANVESAIDDAIAAGIPAAVIMSSLAIDEDDEPPLKGRVRQKFAAAGTLVCGANGMGFYNVRDHVWACGFDSTMHEPPGKVAIISHSGAGMSGIIDCEERLQINFAVSTGNELGVTMDEYLDFVLDLPETRAVGLFVETARNPAGLRRALARAARRGVPVVALKVGRTEESARLAESHSGAMAGDDAAYEALFDRYGVQRVSDQDEWTTALILFAELDLPGPGSLVSLHDSGGERQLLVDLAHELGVPLAKLAPGTVAALERVMPPELPAVNPLDAWSRGGPDAGEAMTHCLSRLLQDPGAALGAVVHDRAPGGGIYRSYLDYMRNANADSGKPVALVAARQGTGHDDAAVSSTSAGFPVLDGLRSFLVGVRALFSYRDFRGRVTADVPLPDAAVADRWRQRLAVGETLGEADSLAMLADFGIATTPPAVANTVEEAVSIAASAGYPVAMKTAMPGATHKTEQRGVVLDIADERRLREHYADLGLRLGPTVLVAPMVGPGEEILLGVKRDPQFGPVVLLGFGGVFAETLGDVTFALPPFDAAHARRCFDRLRLRPLLDGVRGRPAPDVDKLCETASMFSAIAQVLGDVVESIDVNPLIATADGTVAVDALVVGRRPEAAK